MNPDSLNPRSRLRVHGRGHELHIDENALQIPLGNASCELTFVAVSGAGKRMGPRASRPAPGAGYEIAESRLGELTGPGKAPREIVACVEPTIARVLTYTLKSREEAGTVYPWRVYQCDPGEQSDSPSPGIQIAAFYRT